MEHSSSAAARQRDPLQDIRIPPACDRLLRQAEVQKICGGITRSTLYHWRRAGRFPEAIMIASRPFWRESDIQKFIAEGCYVKADGDAEQAA